MNKIEKAIDEMENKIVQFLDKKGITYTNRHGITFRLDRAGSCPRVHVRAMLYRNKKPTANRNIALFMDTMSHTIVDFILHYEIENDRSFNRVKPEHVAEVYMDYYANGSVTYFDYHPKKNPEDIELNFKISNQTTCVSSHSLNFYDEIPGKMHTLSQFQKYIKSHKQLLGWLVNNNAKLKSNFPKNFKLQ
ncbi:MAG: hypothetical protein V4539_06710 [Bacteroidota bacterium]